MRKFRFEVNAREELGLSLLQFLKLRTNMSGKAIKRSIDQHGCKVNGFIEKFSTYRVCHGDKISFEQKEVVGDDCLSLLYCDAYCKAWYKPSFYEVFSCKFPLHRLDKETSGVILNSRESSFFDLFRQRKIRKVYFAICQGHVCGKRGKIKEPIEEINVGCDRKVRRISASGKSAITSWECLGIKGSLCLIRCFPITGRTHQIRIHLSSIGLPILGDSLYSKFKRSTVDRTLLHAYEISFMHPILCTYVKINASLPKDFLAFFSAKYYA